MSRLDPRGLIALGLASVQRRAIFRARVAVTIGGRAGAGAARSAAPAALAGAAVSDGGGAAAASSVAAVAAARSRAPGTASGQPE